MERVSTSEGSDDEWIACFYFDKMKCIFLFFFTTVSVCDCNGKMQEMCEFHSFVERIFFV